MGRPKVLITGAEGFAGRHLARHLHAEGAEVHGTHIVDCELEELDGLATVHRCDITGQGQIRDVLREVQPEEIYHLAAQSSASLSFREPQLTFRINVLGTLNLLEAVREAGLRCRCLVVGSCEVYGAVRDKLQPIKEESPHAPVSPYGISKATQEMLARHYWAVYNLPIISVRPFPHIGPGQSPIFALPNFAQQAAEIELGKREPVIRVGNLSVRRDFLDVRDVVEAYVMALRKGEPGSVYNVCSGKARSMQDMLQMLLSFSTVEVRVEPDPERLRPADIPVLWGDPGRLQCLTGWAPRRELRQTLGDLLDSYRARVRSSMPLAPRIPRGHRR